MSEPLVRTYQTRSGPMLALRSDMYIARSLELYGEYCPGEWKLLKQIIRPGMTVVEVGANIGTHSVNIAQACAPGRFYAFEPQPRIFQILCANLALNDVGNALAYPEGCGEVRGEAVVPLLDYSATNNFGGVSLQESGAHGLKVRITPIDDLDLPACGLLKIDAEGFEPQVMRGARRTIERCRPIIYTENDRRENQAEVIGLLAEFGYRLYQHEPRLFEPNNFNGVKENVFGRVVSRNVLCLPKESSTEVRQLKQINPEEWTTAGSSDA